MFLGCESNSCWHLKKIINFGPKIFLFNLGKNHSLLSPFLPLALANLLLFLLFAHFKMVGTPEFLMMTRVQLPIWIQGLFLSKFVPQTERIFCQLISEPGTAIHSFVPSFRAAAAQLCSAVDSGRNRYSQRSRAQIKEGTQWRSQQTAMIIIHRLLYIPCPQNLNLSAEMLYSEKSMSVEISYL